MVWSYFIFITYQNDNFEVFTNENNAEHNLRWTYITDHLYRILINGSSASGKTNALFNLINEQDRYKSTSVGKIYLYTKDLNEPKYQILIKKCKDIGTKYLDNSKALMRIFEYDGWCLQ